MVIRAEDFAKKAHEGQTRWDGSPYWKHPEQVVKILESWKITNPDIIIASWLHDVLEDTKVTPDQISWEYGLNVRNIVQELTFPPNIEDYQYFERCESMSYEAAIIKIADILANITDISGKKGKHFVEKRLKALAILQKRIYRR